MYDNVVLYEDGTPRTHHELADVVVAIDGDEATASSRVTVVQGGEVVLRARYDDRFVRDDAGGWRFAERRITTDWVGDLSRHYTR